MLETTVTLFLVIVLIVALIGVTACALFLALYGPGAAAGFAAGVYASRLGADPLTAIAISIFVFLLVSTLLATLADMAARRVRAVLG